jgi:hypothetical protein
VNQWSISFNAARIHSFMKRALEIFQASVVGWEVGNYHWDTLTPSSSTISGSMSRTHARTHTHTHTNALTHPPHSSIHFHTHLVTHSSRSQNFISSHNLCISLCFSLSLCVCVCLWFLLFGCPQFAAFIPPPSHLGSKWKKH